MFLFSFTFRLDTFADSAAIPNGFVSIKFSKISDVHNLYN